MKKKVIRFPIYVLLGSLTILLFVVFVPGRYDVPCLQKRAGTRYWNLATGSVIGYTLVPARGEKRPFPVIFLQGGPGGAVSDLNIKSLAPLSESGYNVYLYDQVGSGQSGRLENIAEYSVTRHIRDLEEIIRRTGAKRVVLIGQSWGAILATLYIARNPGTVEKLIVTCPGPLLPVRTELAGLTAPDSLHLREPVFTNRQANEKTSSLRRRAVTWFAVMFKRRLATEHEADDMQTLLETELNKATVCDTSKALKPKGGGGFYASLMTVLSFKEVKDPRPRLRNSVIPVLVMKGQCDNQKWGFTAEYLELFPNHRLAIIPGAGHSIAVEQPELYFSTIHDFLTDKLLTDE
jgi:proline iminopeptidase